MTLADVEALLETWPRHRLHRILHDWHVWARPDQLAPDQTLHGQAWRTWLVLGGRGAGKTRTGAEWVRDQAIGPGCHPDCSETRIALVGETMHDVRSVMVEGASGLLAIHPPDERPKLETSRQRLVWPNGATAQFFSAENPDSLRGPQFTAAWCDEIAKWRRASEVWDMLQFGLRLGSDPRTVVTTTPRPVPLLKQLMEDAMTVVTRARTAANGANLAPAFLREMQRKYGGTRLGRQELDGELIDETVGALWRADWINDARLVEAPALQRIVVAVDPPVTSHKTSDACGIVAAGRHGGRAGRCSRGSDRAGPCAAGLGPRRGLDL